MFRQLFDLFGRGQLSVPRVPEEDDTAVEVLDFLVRTALAVANGREEITEEQQEQLGKGLAALYLRAAACETIFPSVTNYDWVESDPTEVRIEDKQVRIRGTVRCLYSPQDIVITKDIL